MTPAALRAAALEAEQAGDHDGARALFSRAAALAPHDAALLNSVGSFHARHGGQREALAWFDRALVVAPGHAEAMLNRAIALDALGRADESWTALRTAEASFRDVPRYWSIRGNVARNTGRLADATHAYDRCLALQPDHPRALHGRARVALERAEESAPARFDRALARTPQDAQLWLGKAQALAAAGDGAAAQALLRVLIAQAPGWADPFEQLAELRFASGDVDFCDHYPVPASDPVLALSQARVLAGAGHPEAAAEVLAAATSEGDNGHLLGFAEAVYAGEAGANRRADRLFAAFPPADPDEQAQFARHLLRRGDIVAAEALLAAVVTARPDHVAAWALRDLAWRLLGDPRHDWLHGQPGLVAYHALPIEPDAFAAATRLLSAVHDRAEAPVGQSVRSGTQTRGALFERIEREFVPLHAAVRTAASNYRAALPPADREHPLLRHRERPWRVAGSWSVRLTTTGTHTAHIHPAGIVSSACYLIVPPAAESDPDGGALELGRPPPDLRLDLPPVAVLRPEPGKLALFPSTLYHGTLPFTGRERMTIAFDLAPG